MDESKLARARQKMDGVIQLVKDDLLSVQTGRAKPAMVENVKVAAYEGSGPMEIRELATISAPDPHSLVIKPWDQTVLAKIAKALQEANLGINPVVDNEIIRLSIPALTEERRQELVKSVKQKIEGGKAMLRQARGEAKKEIDDQKGVAGVSEDDIFRLNEKLQGVVDEYNKKLDELEKVKEQELMQI
ncbi:MAG: ribosome-recycling factor [Candidatus Beckwithbacteria bacterium]|nr:ribosome-recycling factor [Candidatus Beckwithbacteria bacterium]